MIWCYSFIFFFSKIIPFLLSVIIKRMTWFSRFKLYFDLYACPISSVLEGTYKILRDIAFLFFSNSFQLFSFYGKSISFQSCWSIKSLIFDILCEICSYNLLMIWCYCYSILKVFIIILFWIYCSLLVF